MGTALLEGQQSLTQGSMVSSLAAIRKEENKSLRYSRKTIYSRNKFQEWIILNTMSLMNSRIRHLVPINPNLSLEISLHFTNKISLKVLASLIMQLKIRPHSQFQLQWLIRVMEIVHHHSIKKLKWLRADSVMERVVYISNNEMMFS